jgi:hypothetical protein
VVVGVEAEPQGFPGAAEERDRKSSGRFLICIKAGGNFPGDNGAQFQPTTHLLT